jgi:hypothetical protein
LLMARQKVTGGYDSLGTDRVEHQHHQKQTG